MHVALMHEEYRRLLGDSAFDSEYTGPLVGFDGKEIKINRTSKRIPVKAKLEYIDGVNLLTITANLRFANRKGLSPESFAKVKDAMIRGMKAWEGDYQVFGGQRLKVWVRITENPHIYDRVNVVFMTDRLKKNLTRAATPVNLVDSGKTKEKINGNRSFAMWVGLRREWACGARKIIYLKSKSGEFNELHELYHVTKHEFGHLLGLGDLYPLAEEKMPGVEKGTYPELDAYATSNNRYFLVMCDHHGPVTNNDIEMVVLAFATNRMQLYQKSKEKGVLSEALGKGN